MGGFHLNDQTLRPNLLAEDELKLQVGLECGNIIKRIMKMVLENFWSCCMKIKEEK